MSAATSPSSVASPVTSPSPSAQAPSSSSSLSSDGHPTSRGPDGACGSGRDDVTVVAAETVDGVNLDAGCDTADKPNLYLYPASPTRTSVRLGLAPGQRVFASDPPYRGGWRGTALTDGRFAIDGEVAPFLFYEVTLAPWQSRVLQREEGWCFAPDAAVAGMAARLEDYGFDAVEVDDFVEGWRFDLPPASAYAVYPQLDVEHAAAVTIDPPLRLERLWLLVEEAGACGAMPAPVVEPFDRTGPHAVEWGVVLHGLVR